MGMRTGKRWVESSFFKIRHVWCGIRAKNEKFVMRVKFFTRVKFIIRVKFLICVKFLVCVKCTVPKMRHFSCK